jgi:hypothetical protein
MPRASPRPIAVAATSAIASKIPNARRGEIDNVVFSSL